MKQFSKFLELGPDFLPATDIRYKAEYALASVLLLAFAYLKFLSGQINLASTAFFAVMPDLVFIPILLSWNGRKWPAWGISAYNLTHSLVVFSLAVLVAAWLNSWQFYLPFLGWALHICIDRTIGFNLRKE